MSRTDAGPNTNEGKKPSGAIRILHIDDSPDFVEMASTFLRKNNEEFEIETRVDPTEVPGRLEEDDFDCVVSDCSMPDMEMDGIELHEKVRSDHPDLPYIFFTGTSKSDFPEEAVENESTTHMEKEIDPRQFSDLAIRIEEVARKDD
jgi:DNA-binding NtrC family response regulator